MDTTKKSSQDLRLQVSVPEQTLRLLRSGELLREYPISTSRFGLGTEPGSYRTPLGKFRVCEKFGDSLAPWSILRSREFTGEVAPSGGSEDLVLTRILWLDGMEAHNANTRSRYIYIHGTNHEKSIGVPTSHGCVRMRNADIIDLYEQVPVETPVEIFG